ncbi:hypothetical protein J6I39_01285, partial [bacterium]|nr:hypothetical protein [bacterium]
TPTYKIKHSWDKPNLRINKYFNMILIDKQDPLRNDKVGIIDEIYINIGCSGKKIVEYLETLLKD